MINFFLFKGNKIIFVIILLLFSQMIFPITFKYNTGENLVIKKKRGRCERKTNKIAV